MEGKVVLISGSSSGIGEAVAVEFSRLGCKVVIHGTNSDRLDVVALKCKTASPRNLVPLMILGDIREAEIISELVHTTINYHERLDILVNNAGLFKVTHIDNPDSFNTYKEMMKINLDSVVLLTSLAVPYIKRTKGCIINISSNLHSKCMRGAFAYSVAKSGLMTFTKCLAVDLAPHVRVNSVSPGPVATLMSTRSGVDEGSFRENVGPACLVNRVGEPEEIARVVAFLASPDSGFITGSDFVVDGGSSIKPETKVLGQDS